MSTSEENIKKFLTKTYSNIYNAIAPMIGKGDNPSYLFNMLTTGITIEEGFDVSEFGNQIPLVAKNYASSGRNVQDVYRMILGAECPPDDDENAKQKKQEYDDAIKVLYQDYGKLEPSQMYDAYTKAKEAYDDATCDYYAEANKPKRLQDKNKLRKYKDKLDDAFRTLEVSGKTKIEKALNTITSYQAYTPSAIFEKAGADFQNVSEYDVTTIPSEWTDSDSLNKLAWKKVEIAYSEKASNIYKSVSNTRNEMAENYKNGFWIFYSKKGSAESRDEHMTSAANSKFTTENVNMTMEVAAVKLNRDWLNLSLLNFANVEISGQKKGCITNGTLENTDNCAMPILPDTLVLARNICVYGDFSNEERQFFEEASSKTESAISYGPFSISHKESHFYDSKDESDEDWSKFSAPFKLDFGKTPQIIGVLSSVLKPMFPKKDAPNS